jgi:potassium-dependent mechanosensitive channel
MKLALDQVEATLKREGLTLRTLFDLGRTVAAARDQIRAKTAELEPRFAEITVRLSQLGQAPAAGAPPEDTTIAAERTRLNQIYGDLDAALKQARLLTVRGRQPDRPHHRAAARARGVRAVRADAERVGRVLLGGGGAGIRR